MPDHGDNNYDNSVVITQLEESVKIGTSVKTISVLNFLV